MKSLLTEGAGSPHTKTCSECGETKLLSDFNKHNTSSDGRQQRCRACFSRYNAARYASDRDRFKIAVKRYKEANPDAVFRTRLSIWEQNPDRLNTYRLVEAALNAGVITRPNACTICDLPADEAGAHGLHKHHFDYNEPLAVMWLCPTCHGQLHKLARARKRERMAVAS
jgi:hypothetical protein